MLKNITEAIIVNEAELNNRLSRIEANQRSLMAKIAELSDLMVRRRRDDNDEMSVRFRGGQFKYYGPETRGLSG